MTTLRWVGVIGLLALLSGIAERFGFPEIGYLLLIALVVVALIFKKR